MAVKYDDIAEVTAPAEDLYTKGYQDFQFFAGLCIPHIIRFAFPPLYIAIWGMLVKAVTAEERERILRYAIGLPRGFAKTTFLKILICWLIVYDKIRFVLIVGATEKLAQNIVSDVSEILGSTNVEKIYGPWTSNLATDNKEEKKASYRRRIVILMAVGAGTAIRGINLAYERPDFLLCDDMQAKENADSDTESEHLLDWFTGTLLKVVDPFFATVLYVGNMYPVNCILERLRVNPYWTTLITGCILADKKSLWEEVRPLDSLYQEFKHDEALGRAHIWFAEMMNQPQLGKISLIPNGVIPNPPIDVTDPMALIPRAGFCIIDPAGLKKTSDDNVMLFCYVIDNYVVVMKLIAGVQTPKQVIEATLLHCADLGIRIIAIEDQAYQQTLEFWFKDTLARQGLENHFYFIRVGSRGVHKEKRITASVKNLLESSWFFADADARQRYIFQALSYKIGKPKQKDDILDACAYIETLRMQEYWNMILSIPLAGLVEDSGRLVGEATPF